MHTRLAERVQGVLSWTEGERAATAASMRQLVVQRAQPGAVGRTG